MLKDECIDKCLQEEMIKDKYIGELPQKEINSISDYISNISFLIEKRKNTRTTFVYRGEPRKFDQYCTPNIFRKNILAQYNKELLNHISGDLVFNAMIENLKAAYKNKLEIHEDKLGMYFKALVFWCINECDIYDDEK